MITYFVAFVLSLVVGTAATLGVRNRAHAWNLLDRVGSSRKVHTQAVPRLGGIAIVAGFFAPLLGLLVADSSGVGYVFRSDPAVVQGVFLGGLAIALLGLYDDLRGAGARLKFAVQFSVALSLYSAGFRVETLANPFGAPFELGLLALPFTLLWVVGLINAMNLIDGLDGLAGGVAFIGVGTNFVLAVARGDVLLALFMAALAGAVLGFLVFNFNPASIFMGDTGSMFLGFVLAVVSIKTSSKSGTAVAMLVPIIAMGVPIVDTLLAVIRRSVLGRPLFSADRDHIHHRLMSRVALSHRNAVLVLYGICVLFALTALGLAYANSVQTALLLVGVGIVVTVLVRKLGYFSRADGAANQATRRRNTALRQVVREVTDGLSRAHTAAETWEALQPLAEQLELSRLRLELAEEGSGERQVFERQREAGRALPVQVRVEVRAGQQACGQLEATWADGRAEVNRDEELALEILVDVLARRLAVGRGRSPSSDRVVSLRKQG
jgi:UDP-GlcNAc:undecaprenyl-phosphate GlcNAc-1-phosphate transferase